MDLIILWLLSVNTDRSPSFQKLEMFIRNVHTAMAGSNGLRLEGDLVRRLQQHSGEILERYRRIQKCIFYRDS